MKIPPEQITIEVSEKKRYYSPSLATFSAILQAVKEGRSVIFNVKIDSKRKKIYVTKGAVIVHNIIDVENVW